MPSMKGNSLRDRMSREGQLPLADAIRITTEVAAALDYAHRHDVVHRDIKPENILMHDGRSDVYSLGCVLFEMLCGEPPFTGPAAQAMCRWPT